MPANNVEQIKIWKKAHEWLKQVSDEYKSRGISSASMTQLASQAILSIPLPNGTGNCPEDQSGSAFLSVAEGADGTAPQPSPVAPADPAAAEPA